MAAAGTLTTNEFELPTCQSGAPLTLHLNIFSSIGRGAVVELHDSAPGIDAAHVLARSEAIQGGGVDHVVVWARPEQNVTHNYTTEWVNGGCACTLRPS